jgi:predicted glycosyltransferase
VALVLRKQRAATMAAAQRDPAIKWVDRFLIPHPSEEFALTEMPKAWQSRARRLGPVVRTLQLDRVASTKQRYSQSSRPLVVVTIGGGGFPESYQTLVAAEQAALAATDKFDWVLVYGPYYPHAVPPSEGRVHRIKFEANLLELCAAADVVVCNAGYNTIRELAVAGTPAVVIPLRGTGADDQHERANLLAQGGNAVVAQATAADILSKVQELLDRGPQTRREPEPGEPATLLGQRFLQALVE